MSRVGSSGMGVSGFLGSAANLGEYFTNLPRFVIPMSDYHAFYLFWWFSWSIMIGQFVSRFVGGMRTWQLAAALLVIPSVPLAAWFRGPLLEFARDILGSRAFRERGLIDAAAAMRCLDDHVAGVDDLSESLWLILSIIPFVG